MNAALRLQLPPRLRSVFISDLHLGSTHCQAGALADFLEQLRCDRLYLVGDIVDLWWMAKRRAVWGREQDRVFECLQALSNCGTQMIYVPGNHDRPARRFCGLMLPRLKVRRRVIHTTADGRRLLVTHGDEHDAVTHFGNLQEWFGDKLYDLILVGNRLTNRARNRLGLRYWSLAEFLKRQSDAAERYIARFVAAAVSDARRRRLDGVICGHIHRPALQHRDGVIYANDGDWVESLTALTEAQDGTLSLVHWSGRMDTIEQMPPRLVLTAQRLPVAA